MDENFCIPVRCFTCNNVIANKWCNKDGSGYVNLLKNGLSKKDALDSLKINNYCCRRMFLTHV